MSAWAENRIGEMIAVNPVVKLTKGFSYPFIDIDKVEKQYKLVSNVEERVFDGQGGSRFQNGDVVFSRITPCLENRKIAQVSLKGEETGFGSTEFFVFRSKKGITDPRFVYYFVSSDWVVLPAINSMTGASGRQRADRGFVEKLKFSFPPIEKQTRIADILSAYDDAIENNNRRIALLEQAARELYREWFVRMRFPGHETAMFVNGLPEGWEVKRLGEFSHVTDGTHDTPKEADSGVPLVTGKCIKDGFVDFDNAYLISESDHKAISRRSGLESGDILLSNIGTVGSICVVEYDREFSVKNVIILKPKSAVKTAYLYYLMTSSYVQDILSVQTNGASQQFVGLTFMRRFKVLVPGNPILDSFAEIITPILTEKQVLHSKSLNLARQRDMILPRLMSGKLEV